MAEPVDDLPAPAMLERLRHVAEVAARAGGMVAKQHFGGALHVEFKPDRSEVSDADHAAQAAVVAVLRAARPDDALLAEESLADTPGPLTPPRDDIPCWVIDPLDGTRNFVRRIALYACSVGLMLNGQPLVGAVYDPVREILYSAIRGGPLLVNGQPHQGAAAASATESGRRPVVALPSLACGPIAAIAHQWLDRCVCRNLGSTALHLAMVATGELDAALFDNARLWDLAAGGVLIDAAGGRMTTPAGTALFPLTVARYAGEELPAIAVGPRLGDRLPVL